MKKHIAIACCAFASGCVSADPGSSNVKLLSNPALVSSCKFIKQETVITRGYETWGETMTTDTQTKMQNAASSVGGTHVLTKGPQMMGRVNAMQMTGDIYRC